MKRIFTYFTNDQIVLIFAVTLIFIAVITWIHMPSPFKDPDTEYTKCLELVLSQGNIADAQLMCSDRKK